MSGSAFGRQISYFAEPPPGNLDPQLAQYLLAEFGKLAQAINASWLQIPPLAAPPPRPVDGIVANADGVNWNPGAGAGPYAYVGGVWVKL